MEKRYQSFKKGLITTLEDYSIPDDASSKSLGWLAKGDHIELTRGRNLFGATENTGAGKITGLHVARRADGTEQPFRVHGRIVEYFDLTTLDWVEVGTNILPATIIANDAYGEDVFMHDYASTAGAQMFLNSPNGDYLKFMVANPASYASVYLAANNFKGYISIRENRTFLWGRNEDKTGLYGSKIDELAFTTVAAEVLADTATGTLAFKGGGARRTCFAVVITDTSSGEVFTDDYNGVLVGSLGGTGTINYMTGAFTTSQSGAGTADYQWEDSASEGIADFRKSATRVAGEGFVFRQDDGGGSLLSVASYGDAHYCLHEKKAWALTITIDDTNATNLPYREQLGLPSIRAKVETGNGIWYVDNTVQGQPRIRVLTIDKNNDKVIPIERSLNIDLSDYEFDQAAGVQWNDYIIFACRTADSPVNNRLILLNLLWGSYDIIESYVSCFAVYQGTLLVGDSLSNNVYTIFSGVDDDDSPITNYWEGKNGELDIPGQKKNKRLVIEGNIGPDQEIEVWASLDQSAFVSIGTIRGDGDYVDSASVSVGAVTVGRSELGGGSEDGAIPAYHYVREFTQIALDKFNRIKLKFVANALGYASVSDIWFKDIRYKGQKVSTKYR